MDDRISFNGVQTPVAAPAAPLPPTESQPQPQTESQPVYEPQGVPAEMPNTKNGQMYGIISIICAAISILFLPILFGPTGIILGTMAMQRGNKTIGLVGIILSSIFMVIGLLLGIVLAIMQQKGMLGGALLFIFK